MLPGRLPGETNVVVLIPPFDVGGPAQVGRVVPRVEALSLVEKAAAQATQVRPVAPPPVPRIEPETIPFDRPAQPCAKFIDELDGGLQGQSTGHERRRQIRLLQMMVRIVGHADELEGVAAFLGHVIELGPTSRYFRSHVVRLNGYFHGAERIGAEVLGGSAGDAHAIQKPLHVRAAASVDAKRRRNLPAIATDIDGVERLHGPDDERGKGGDVLPVRKRLEDLVRDDGLLADVLNVHDRAGARYRDRLLERAHAHLGVGRCGEPCRQLNPFPLERTEAGKDERDRIGPRPQVDNLVVALVVRDDGANLFNQRWAGRFYRDPGQHAARRVSHRSPDGARRRGLRPRGAVKHQEC